MPLIENIFDWLIGMAGATVLIEICFRVVGNLQRRLQQEIAERQRAEESLRQAHDKLERRVQERTAELTRANKALQAEIVERRWMEGVLEHRAAQLTLINQIGRRVAAELDADEVLRTAAALIQESFDYHHVALFTVDHEQEEAVLRAVAGLYAAHKPAGYRLRLAEGMVGWTAAHGTMRLANDVSADPAIPVMGFVVTTLVV